MSNACETSTSTPPRDTILVNCKGNSSTLTNHLLGTTLDLDLTSSRPATRHSVHMYLTQSGGSSDPQGEMTCTLDDASKVGQRLFVRTQGQSQHEAIETKDVSGNTSSNIGVAHNDERTSKRKQVLRNSIN